MLSSRTRRAICGRRPGSASSALALAGRFAAVLVDQHPRERDHVLGLVAEESRGRDCARVLVFAERDQVFFRRVGDLEQAARGLATPASVACAESTTATGSVLRVERIPARRSGLGTEAAAKRAEIFGDPLGRGLGGAPGRSLGFGRGRPRVSRLSAAWGLRDGRAACVGLAVDRPKSSIQCKRSRKPSAPYCGRYRSLGTHRVRGC